MNRKLIEQLADALDHFDDVDKTEAAITAAKEYLAQPEQSEPVGEVVHEGVIRWKFRYPTVGTKLYTAPPLRELSESEVMQIAKPYITCVGSHWEHEDAIRDNGAIEDFAKAILAAARSK